jgi:hypothetical protein
MNVNFYSNWEDISMKKLLGFFVIPVLTTVLSFTAAAAGLPSVKDDVDTNTTNISINAENTSINASGIAGNASDILALQSGGGSEPDYSGYGTPFSADANTKNVIVYKTTNSDGSGSYNAAILYTNTLAEEIIGGGGPITPPFIGKFVTAGFDSNGALTFLSVYTEGVQTPEYLVVEWESIDYDPITGDPFFGISSGNYTDTCVGGGGSGAVGQFCETVEINEAGGLDGVSQNVSIRRLVGPGDVGSLSYSDLLVRDKYSGSRHSFRIQAKGIGNVMRVNDGRPMRIAIYYNVEGATDGDLTGTPFENGAMPFGGVFF